MERVPQKFVQNFVKINSLGHFRIGNTQIFTRLF